MKFIVALTLALLAVVDAGVQTYRQGGNFAYAFTTQHPHQAVPLLYQHPLYLPKSLTQQVSYAYKIEPNTMDYSPYRYLLLLNSDELFRVDEDETETENKYKKTANIANALPTTTNSVSASATASTFNSGLVGVPSFSSATNAVAHYPFLTLFHRLFSRPSLFSRPTRPVTTVSSGPPLMRPVLNNINDSITQSIAESLNLMNPFGRPRP